MRNFAVLMLLSALMLASCKPAYIRKGLREIRCERQRLGDAQSQFAVMDTAQVRSVYSSYLAKIDSINVYFKDQYSDGAWQLMTEFGQIKKPLKTYLMEYQSIKGQFNYSFTQLADLESDLKEKLISREQFVIYFKSESEANSQLIIHSNLVSENCIRRVNHYNEISPRIDSLIMVFKAGFNK